MKNRIARLLLFVGLSAVVLQAVPYPFFDGFESGSFADWINDSGTYTKQVTTATAASGSYSLTMTGGTSSHWNGIHATWDTPQTPAVASFSIRVASTSAAAGYFNLGASTSNHIINFYMNSTGKFKVNGRESSFSYAINTWYTVRLEMNWTAKTVDMYVDDALAVSAAPFYGSGSPITSVWLYNFHSSTAWWDNINIGQADPGSVNGSCPFFADLDGDGDQDMLLGDGTGAAGSGTGQEKDGWRLMSSRYNSLQAFGGITLYRNTGSDSAAVFHLADTSFERGTAPAAADMDGDGDPDLLIGTADGNVTYYRADSTAGGPVYTLVDTNYFNIDVQTDCRPAPADLDGDGDIDLLTGRADGRIGYYRNDGSASSPYLALVDSQFYNIDVGTHSAPSLVDIDNDGDLDLMIGNGAGLLAYYRNDGTALSPTYVRVDSNYFAIDAGSNLAPAWADLDADGDYDLYAGRSSGGVLVYRNTGTASAAYFTSASTAYDFALSVSSSAAPVLADLDSDGDNDLLLGTAGGNLVYYRNDGSATLPAWAAPDTAYGGIKTGTYSVPALADVDNDNDLDLFVGKADGRLSFYRNDGSASAPAWTLVDSGYFNIDVGSYSIPALTDIDGDGDPDLFIGTSGGTMYFYENRGTVTAPLFVLASSAYAGIDVGSYSAPAFADPDANGVMDLFIGTSTGAVYAYYNTGTADSADFVLVDAGYADLTAGSRCIPAFGDLDGDGDADLLLGRSDGYLGWYRNEGAGTDLVPDWGQVENGFQGIDIGSYSVPAWVDIDGDGDEDLFVGSSTGRLNYYRNDGTAESPACTLISAYYDSIAKSSYTAPAFGDYDGDGDQDLFLGALDGTISLYRNDGTALSPAWSLLDANYFNIDVGSYSTPVLADIDADGDLDLFIGNSSGVIYFYRNEGTATSPYWRQESTYYGSIDVGSNAAPAFTDIDGDGDLDLFIGNSLGQISFYVNDSTAQVPAFVLDQAAYNSIDVGSNATPVFADIDADGRTDLFVGNSSGTIDHWEMTRQATAILDPDLSRQDLVPSGLPAGMYDLYGRRVYGQPVRPGVYLLVPEDGSGIVKKVLNP